MSPEQPTKYLSKFPVGAKVRHKRTGFTFVVVDHDPKHLGEPKPDYAAARRLIGRKLHKMKSFPDKNLELV